MALLSIEKATLSHGLKSLLHDITFSVNAGDRIGLVGNNGCGKSSLLKAMTGEYELNKGRIVRQKGLSFGYVPQEFDTSKIDLTPYEFLLDGLSAHQKETEFWKANIILSEAGLPDISWHKPLRELSGGWKRFLQIKRASINDPDMLMLDEPTNHLDDGKLFELEAYLRGVIKISYVVVSHDREFLDQCTTKTVFIRADGAHVFAAPFSSARAELIQRDVAAMRARKSEAKEIRRLEGAADRLRAWSVKRGFSEALARRARTVESRVERAKGSVTIAHEERTRTIGLSSQEVTSNSLINIKRAEITKPDGSPLLTVNNLVVQPNDRIVIMGGNGSGKSVFLKWLTDTYKAYVPGSSALQDVYFSPQIRVAYFDQHLDKLPTDKIIHAYLSATTHGLNTREIVSELVNAGFPVEQHRKTISSLSYGERTRLALLGLKLSNANFYVLDEATNHLDIEGKEQLEGVLDNKGMSCLFVSHDRHLVSGVATRFFQIQSGTLIEIDDAESYYQELRKPGDVRKVIEPETPRPKHRKQNRFQKQP